MKKTAVKKKWGRTDIPEQPSDLIKIDYELLTLFNLYRLYEDHKKEIPGTLPQLRDIYDCHFLTFNCNLKKSKVSKSIKELELEAELTGGGDGTIHVDDIVPHKRWSDKNYGANVELTLDPQNLFPSFMPIKSPVKGEATFRLKWQPTILDISSLHAGRKFGWTLKKSSNSPYLDGENEFAVIIRRKRDVKDLKLHIKAKLTLEGYDDTPKEILKEIPLEIIESAPAPKPA